MTVNHWYRTAGKRTLDVTVSLFALLLLAPVMLTISMVVFLKLGWPVLFRQERPGLNAHPFTLYKFRTMRDARDKNGSLLPDGERLTPFGRFLRSSSLDELPELINVLKGDMSLVGPRPLLMRYTPYYTKTEQLRHTVRPGITGWAQLNGRNDLNWNTRLEADVWYVQNCSLMLDISILLRTFIKVVKQDGVIVNPGASMQDLDQERRNQI